MLTRREFYSVPLFSSWAAAGGPVSSWATAAVTTVHLGRQEEACFMGDSSRTIFVLGSSRMAIFSWAAQQEGIFILGGCGKRTNLSGSSKNYTGQRQQERDLGRHEEGPASSWATAAETTYILGDRRRRASLILGSSSRNYISRNKLLWKRMPILILGSNRRASFILGDSCSNYCTSWATGGG